VNFLPLPESVGEGCKFAYPQEIDHVPGAIVIPFCLGRYMRSKNVTQVMLWDEKLVGGERPRRMFAQFEKVLLQLSKAGRK